MHIVNHHGYFMVWPGSHSWWLLAGHNLCLDLACMSQSQTDASFRWTTCYFSLHSVFEQPHALHHRVPAAATTHTTLSDLANIAVVLADQYSTATLLEHYPTPNTSNLRCRVQIPPKTHNACLTTKHNCSEPPTTQQSNMFNITKHFSTPPNTHHTHI